MSWLSVKNNTGRTLNLYATIIKTDSTKNTGRYYSRKNTNMSLEDMKSIGSDLRIDVIGIDDSTKDTICMQSFSQEDLKSGVIELKAGVLNKPAPVDPMPRLIITGTRFYILRKTGDEIKIRANGPGTIRGKLIRFDKKSITILTSEGKEEVVLKENFKSIKICSGYGIGRRVIFRNCRFRKSNKTQFRMVRQKYEAKYNSWVWSE
ncbi:MAG: hypothetical protein IAF38_06775 [Bacteroidia bacterium]|nr:hypothetical protein [Bacteroidia bacterium]